MKTKLKETDKQYLGSINVLKKEIINKNEELNNLKLQLNNKSEKIKYENDKLQETDKQYLGSIDDLKKEIRKKNEELYNIKLQLKKCKEELYNKTEKIKNENNISKAKTNDRAVNIISQDSRINYAIPCSGSDVFAEVEEKLYLEYPEYRETNNIFLANGSAILRFKTIDQNNIGTGKPITMIIPED